MAVGDLMQARAVYTLHGQTCMTVLHYVNILASASFQDFATSFSDTLSPALISVMSNECVLVRVDTAKIFPLPASYTISTTEGDNGALTGPSEASSVAQTITKQTAFSGRKYRGRIYLPGVPISAVTQSQLNAGSLLGLQGLADKLAQPLQVVGANAFVPVLAHYKKTAVPPWSWDNIVRMRANPILRNQRRRQIGVGI